MVKIKSFWKFIFIFIFFLLILVIFGFHNNQFDPMWNFGYSYAMSIGEIPYKDFTLLTTPLFPFLFSIGLRIFGHDNIVFLTEQALLITFTFYFLFKIYDKKAWIMMFAFIFPFLNNIVPTYNFLAYSLMIVVIYLEKENKNDYLIGFILGLIFLTKQSIGLCMIIPSIIFYYKKYKVLLKRAIGFLFPCIIFFIYLLITGSLFNFIDICFLGMFDFASNNSNVFTVFFFLALVMVGILLLIIKKNRKDIINYYILCSFSFLIPIFTEYHFYMFFMCFILALLPFVSAPNKTLIFIINIVCISICLFCFIVVYSGLHTVFLKDVHNFKYYLIDKGSKKSLIDTLDLYQRYKTKEKSPIFLGTQSVYFTIANEEKIDYFDILNRGNYGYKGTQKMINKIKKMKNQIFIINMNKYKHTGVEDQLDKDIIKYVIKHSKKIDNLAYYYVYLKE